MATAAQRLRKEGLEVTQTKVILNPGEFPAQVRAVYQVPSSPPTTNGDAADVPVETPPEHRSAASQMRERLLAGEELTSTQAEEEYGVNRSNLGQVVQKLRDDRYLITIRKEANRAFYRCTPTPMNRRPAKNAPKWVVEAEEEEAFPRSGTVANPPRAPRLLSVVSKTELVDGEIRLTIQDGDEFFEAVLVTQRP